MYMYVYIYRRTHIDMHMYMHGGLPLLSVPIRDEPDRPSVASSELNGVTCTMVGTRGSTRI